VAAALARPTTVSHAARKDAGAAVRNFDVTASRFKFDPAVLEVVEGDEVQLTARSADTTHGFEIKELGVKLKIPKGGSDVTVTFVASRAGSFDIACSEYCGPGHKTMKARLVVAPKGSR
jgi:cytochrome c oxidase subunit 2